MDYQFKIAQEIAWGALAAAGIFVVQTLVGFDPTTIADPHQWVVVLAGGVIRAAAGGVLAVITTMKKP